MLSLQLKSGEYLTIGDDIVVQVFTTSAVRVSVQAPRDMAILRGEVLERTGEERPDCLYDHSTQKPKKKKRLSNPQPRDHSVSSGKLPVEI